jgi:hypothetical protein
MYSHSLTSKKSPNIHYGRNVQKIEYGLMQNCEGSVSYRKKLAPGLVMYSKPHWFSLDSDRILTISMHWYEITKLIKLVSFE